MRPILIPAYLVSILLLAGICSCSVFERASQHGFVSGSYAYKSEDGQSHRVYLDIDEDSVTAFPLTGMTPGNEPLFRMSMEYPPKSGSYPERFTKSSMDIDLTTILFKFRPAIQGLPAQFTTDFNAALYAGWRADNFLLKKTPSLVHKSRLEVKGRGFDGGFFFGPGTTLVAPFVTNGKVVNEYNGMILQYGAACFLESNLASFGLSVGFDYLLSSDRKIWIYEGKPWLGFIVGIAVN